MGLEDSLRKLSEFSPKERDIVELKYTGGKVSLPLARLSKVVFAFGYMSDCTILDSEPNYVAQLRLLVDGEVDIAVISMAEMTAQFAQHSSLPEALKFIDSLKTGDEAVAFMSKVPVSRMTVKAPLVQ